MINTSSSGSSPDELIDDIPSAEISRGLPHAIVSGLITYEVRANRVVKISVCLSGCMSVINILGSYRETCPSGVIFPLMTI